MEQKRNNYDIMARNARALFMKEDQEKLIKKFNLKADLSYLYLRFLDMTYRIERSGGDVQKSTDGETFTVERDYASTMSIFDYLCWSKDARQLSGRWISGHAMGHSFHTSLLEGEGSMYNETAKYFAEHTQELEKACRRLGGQKMAVGDVSYVLGLFDELPIYFQFWDGDEEFPPKVFFLWDCNTQQYVHYETTYYIMKVLLDRIVELMAGD